MKVTLSSIDFNNALNAVFKAIPSRPTHPILSNVLIKTENNCLVISATDLTTFISLKIPANITIIIITNKTAHQGICGFRVRYKDSLQPHFSRWLVVCRR